MGFDGKEPEDTQNPSPCSDSVKSTSATQTTIRVDTTTQSWLSVSRLVSSSEVKKLEPLFLICLIFWCEWKQKRSHDSETVGKHLMPWRKQFCINALKLVPVDLVVGEMFSEGIPLVFQFALPQLLLWQKYNFSWINIMYVLQGNSNNESMLYNWIYRTDELEGTKKPGHHGDRTICRNLKMFWLYFKETLLKTLIC